jgi:hypothetical protein
MSLAYSPMIIGTLSVHKRDEIDAHVTIDHLGCIFPVCSPLIRPQIEDLLVLLSSPWIPSSAALLRIYRRPGRLQH